MTKIFIKKEVDIAHYIYKETGEISYKKLALYVQFTDYSVLDLVKSSKTSPIILKYNAAES